MAEICEQLSTSSYFQQLATEEDLREIAIPLGSATFQAGEVSDQPGLEELSPFLDRVFSGYNYSGDLGTATSIVRPESVDQTETIYRGLLYTAVCRLGKFNQHSDLSVSANERRVIREWSSGLHQANLQLNPDYVRQNGKFDRFVNTLRHGVKTAVLQDCITVLPLVAAEMRADLTDELQIQEQQRIQKQLLEILPIA